MKRVDEAQTFLQNLKKLSSSVNTPSIQIGEVVEEEPNLKIKVNDLILDKEDFFINEYLLNEYKRKYKTQMGKLDLSKADLEGIGDTEAKSGGEHKHDVLHLEDVITEIKGEHVHNVNNVWTETNSVSGSNIGAPTPAEHKHIISGKTTEPAGNHQHKLLNYEPVETDEQKGMSSHSHKVTKLDFKDGDQNSHDGEMTWDKLLHKGDLLAVLATEDRQNYIIFCKVVRIE